ncbi:DUF4397 domain-containing protein [Jeotgalibacillus sp. R-1-5s-1]|uniref:DUF4397 domain-containing protein n=1 Tax=Jeotgalibacillus sp. R-1-5s-1 TaxID=2555897 RepID=UPI00106D2853|nr:DUF4397 domain-containing protein [Jeotgalibacillus sp. R-1-5s-1]TFD95497.1 DUF4397 domain-containing protein [Jeotgalibacillus sp. R-1-5s-1]
MKKLLGSLLAAVMMMAMMGGAALADNHEGGEGWVRILHASPDAPAVDVYVNGEAVVEGAAFKDYTDYLALPAGDHEVEIFPAGDTETAVISETLTVESGMYYTASAIGTLDSISLNVTQDDLTIGEGMTKVRAGHFSPDAPAVDVGLIGGDAVFSGAEFPGVTDFAELEAGSYDLEVRTPEGDQVLDLSGTELEAGMAYSVYAVNTLDSIEALVLTAPAANAMPSEMPETGMGGMAQENNSFMLYAAAAALMGGAVIVFAVRRRAHNN